MSAPETDGLFCNCPERVVYNNELINSPQFRPFSSRYLLPRVAKNAPIDTKAPFQRPIQFYIDEAERRCQTKFTNGNDLKDAPNTWIIIKINRTTYAKELHNACFNFWSSEPLEKAISTKGFTEKSKLATIVIDLNQEKTLPANLTSVKSTIDFAVHYQDFMLFANALRQTKGIEDQFNFMDIKVHPFHDSNAQASAMEIHRSQIESLLKGLLTVSPGGICQVEIDPTLGTLLERFGGSEEAFVEKMKDRSYSGIHVLGGLVADQVLLSESDMENPNKDPIPMETCLEIMYTLSTIHPGLETEILDKLSERKLDEANGHKLSKALILLASRLEKDFPNPEPNTKYSWQTYANDIVRLPMKYLTPKARSEKVHLIFRQGYAYYQFQYHAEAVLAID